MKLNGLARKVGKSVPYVMTLQKKFGLPACKDYPAGYAVLVKKLIATSPFTWSVRGRCAVSKGEAVEIYREPFATKQMPWNHHALGEMDGTVLIKFPRYSSLLPLLPSIHEGRRRLSICSLPDKEIKSLLAKEKKLLELLKVDSLHDGELWFESMCTMIPLMSCFMRIRTTAMNVAGRPPLNRSLPYDRRIS